MPVLAPAPASVSTVRRVLPTLLRYIAICLGIGLFITGLSGGRGLAANMLYSLAIGMSCMLLIEAGRRLAARWVWRREPDHPHASGDWPGWPLMSVVIVVGCVGGYSIGAAIGNALTGQNLPLLWNIDSRSSVGSLTISLAAAVIFTYLFWLRGRLAATQARAEAAQRLAAQTQLRLLESQLEPHMLFNTLANLRALIALDAPRAQVMLDHLIGFLRSTLAASRATMHPLRAEFERSADYLALMQVRLGERLVTTLDLPPELAEHAVPPLLLQPLLENAIQHGIEPHRAGGHITLQARRDGGQLQLSVRDTGAGLGHGASTAGTGFGSTQVRERLATLYGEAARLQIEAAEDATGGGTLATITLPLDRAGS